MLRQPGHAATSRTRGGMVRYLPTGRRGAYDPRRRLIQPAWQLLDAVSSGLRPVPRGEPTCRGGARRWHSWPGLVASVPADAHGMTPNNSCYGA